MTPIFQGNAVKFFQQNLQTGDMRSSEEKAYQKEIQARHTQTFNNNNNNNSNLNSFSLPNNGGDVSNLLVVLQGFQAVTSRSNVILVANSAERISLHCPERTC